MVKAMANKKHLVASFHNLSPELQEEIKQKYPLGFTDATVSYTHLTLPTKTLV